MRKILSHLLAIKLWKKSVCVLSGLMSLGLPVAAEEFDYTASDGTTHQFWIPDATIASGDPIRCVLITAANPGQGERFYTSSEFKDLAAKYDMMLVRLNKESHSGGASLCNYVAERFNRSELQGAGIKSAGGTLPVVWAGVSIMGQDSVYISENSSDVTAAVLAWRARFYYAFDGGPDPDQVKAVKGVPVLAAMSYEDDHEGRTACIDVNVRGTARGSINAEWTSLMQSTSNHSDAGDLTFAARWLDAVLAQRLPAGVFDKDSNPLNAPDTGANARGGDYTRLEWGVFMTLPPYRFNNPSIVNPYVEDSTHIWLPNQDLADLWLITLNQYIVYYQTNGAGGTVNAASHTGIWGTEAAPSVTATAAAGYKFASWTWDNFDGSYEAFNSAVVIEDVGQAITATAHFVTNASPVASITASTTAGVCPLDVTFTSVAGMTAYAWDFDGDGVTDSTVANPIHQYTEISKDGSNIGYTVNLITTDSSGIRSQATKTITTHGADLAAGSGAAGTINRDIWRNVGPGTEVSTLTSRGDYPNAPHQSTTLTIFNEATDADTIFGDRIYGFIHPPVSGDYVFRLAADDEAELWLSTDATEGNRVLIASNATPSGYQDWLYSAGQSSGAVTLVAGQQYFIEVIRKQYAADSYVSLAWQTVDANESPLSKLAVIGSGYLSPGTAPSGDSDPTAVIDAPYTAVEGDSSYFNGLGSYDDGAIVSYTWDFGDTGSATTANTTHAYASAGTYTVTLTVEDGTGHTGVSTFSVEVVSFGTAFNDLIAWYEFEDGTGTTVTDSSGNGYDATLVPGATDRWVTDGGVSGNGSYFFNGDGYITLPQSALDALNSSKDDFTIVTWLHVKDLDGDGNQQILEDSTTKLYGGSNEGAQQYAFGLYAEYFFSNTNLGWDVGSDGVYEWGKILWSNRVFLVNGNYDSINGAYYWDTTNNIADAAEWMFLSTGNSSGGVTAFHGQFATSVGARETTRSADNVNEFVLGRLQSGSTASADKFYGLLDNFMLFDRSLTATELLDLRANGGFILNRAPVAVITVDNSTGPSPFTIHFDATFSTDAENGPLTYEWDFDNDGIRDSTAASPQVTYSTPTVRTVKLTVTDGLGLVDTQTIDITILDAATIPEIAITGNGQEIVDGDTTPSKLDATNFVTALVGNSVLNTFTISNTGGTTLNLTGAPLVSVSGTHAADFTVSASPASTVAVGANTTFSVTFAPAALGIRTATVSVANDDVNEGNYTFNVVGQGIANAPEIAIEGNNQEIVNGDSTPAAADHTDFNNVPHSEPSDRTFTIVNEGDANLNLGSVTISGANASDFSILVNPAFSVISAAASTNLTIRLIPTALGLRTATISIASDDSDENPYEFDLQATAIPAYYVAYYGNGNTTGTAPIDDTVYIDLDILTIPSVGDMARTAATFAGWNTVADGSGVQYAPSDTISMSADVTLYAQWFFSDLGSLQFATGTPDSMTFTDNATISLEVAGTGETDRPWRIGETLNLAFDIEVTAPSDPGYKENGLSLGFAIGDGSDAIGFGWRYFGNGQLWVVADTDSSAATGSALNYGISAAILGAAKMTKIDDTAHDLKNAGETAHLDFSVTKTSAYAYTIHFTWRSLDGSVTQNGSFVIVTSSGETTETYVINDGVEIDRFNSFLAKMSTYGAGANPGDFSLTNVTMSLEGVVAATDNYNEWINTLYPSETDPATIDMTADPDHNGLPNVFDYILDISPTRDRASALLQPTVDSTHFIFVFTRKEAANYLNPVTQYTDDLSTAWTTAVDGVNGVSILIEADPMAVNGVNQVTVKVPIAGQTSRFFRLKTDLP